MSKIHRAFTVLLALAALTVMAPGHAETPTQEGQQSVASAFIDEGTSRVKTIVNTVVHPIVNPKELACLARNIFFEAASEPEEGKVAVGLVTLNRTQDGRFRNTVCGVVDQSVTTMIARQSTREVKTTWGRTKQEPVTVWSKLTICQFSWRCMFVKNPKSEDERWQESQRIALELLSDSASYSDLRDKYANALYFHATGIRPAWARQKTHVSRVGGHHFYGERNQL